MSASTDRYELQVLAGAQQGARAALPAGRTLAIGDSLDGDILLRGSRGRRVELAVGADGLLEVVVAAGSIELDGQPLAAGQSARVPLATPLVLGDARVGVVRIEQPADAQRAEGGGTAGAAGGVDAAGAAARRGAQDRIAGLAARAAPFIEPLVARFSARRVAVAGGALAAASAGVLAFAYAAAPGEPTLGQKAERAQAVLRGAAMPGLAVAAKDGALEVTGYLESAAERARAEELLAPFAPPSPRWQVWVNEQVAQAVQDVYRVNGIDASVQATGPGRVRVQATGDALALDNVRNVARRDVPGLAAIEVHAKAPARTPAAVIDDPGKRVASIVPGDPAYVVTVDGTRYFVGALLPTGHRIHTIEANQVVLEFDGVHTPLVF
jgi:type III secretion protein D